MKPLITIGIPVYNVEKYVERCLLSVLNQTYDNLEILIVDDKGSDCSMDIVRRVAIEHPRGNQVCIIDHDVNKGIGATRNTTLDNAHGTYIFWLDSDDYITDNCIELLYNRAVETNSDLVIGSFQEITPDGKPVRIHQQESYTSVGDDAFEKFYKSGNFYPMIWNKLYRTDILLKNNVRTAYNSGEDSYFSFQLFPIIKRIATLSDITHSYVVLNSTSDSENIKRGIVANHKIAEYSSILQKMYEYLKVSCSTNGQKQIMAIYILNVKTSTLRIIARAKNLNIHEKRQLLSTVPVFPDIECAGLLSVYNRCYIKNPIRAARIEWLLAPCKPLYRMVAGVLRK